MFEEISFWGQIVAGVVILAVALSWVWSKIKTYVSSSVPSNVTSVLEKVADYTDETVAWTALQTAALLFKKHKDTESAQAIANLSAKVLMWDDVEEAK